jgi:hypothetical protein
MRSVGGDAGGGGAIGLRGLAVLGRIAWLGLGGCDLEPWTSYLSGLRGLQLSARLHHRHWDFLKQRTRLPCISRTQASGDSAFLDIKIALKNSDNFK